MTGPLQTPLHCSKQRAQPMTATECCCSAPQHYFMFLLLRSHGFLLQPMSRSFVSYKFDPPDKRDYNPQGMNAGGRQWQQQAVSAPQLSTCITQLKTLSACQVERTTMKMFCVVRVGAGKQVVYDNGRLHWPNGQFALCGEPWNQAHKRYEQPGRITGAVVAVSYAFITKWSLICWLATINCYNTISCLVVCVHELNAPSSFCRRPSSPAHTHCGTRSHLCSRLHSLHPRSHCQQPLGAL